MSCERRIRIMEMMERWCIWLCIWFAYGLVQGHGYVKKSTWEQKEYVNGLMTCNPGRVSFREEESSYLKTTTKPLAQRTLKTKLLPTRMSKIWDRLQRESQMAFIGSSLFYSESCFDWEGESCKKELDRSSVIVSLDMDQFAEEVFYNSYGSDGSSKCRFDISNAPPVPSDEDVLSESCYIFRLFQKHYPEHRRHVGFDSKFPSMLSSSESGKYLAWMEELSGNVTALRVFDLNEKHILPDEAMNYGESIETGQPSSIMMKRSQPVFCGDRYLFYEGGDSIFLRDLGDSTYHVETVARGSFFPVASAVSPDVVVASMGAHACTAGWVSKSMLAVTLFILPSRETIVLGQDMWSTGNFTLLHDLALSGDHLFLILRDPIEDRYLLRMSYIVEGTMKCDDVADSMSDTPLTFHSTTAQSTILYSKRGVNGDGTDDELRLLNVKDHVVSHCLVESPVTREKTDDGTTSEQKAKKRILDATFFKDMVVWMAQYTDQPYAVLEFLDLDKDNDDVIDILDEFPFNNGFTFDKDQDGYADEFDFLDSAGINDDYIMYSVFVGFNLVIISCVYCLKKYFHYLVRKRHEDLQRLQDEDETGASSPGGTGNSNTIGIGSDIYVKRNSGNNNSNSSKSKQPLSIIPPNTGGPTGHGAKVMPVGDLPGIPVIAGGDRSLGIKPRGSKRLSGLLQQVSSGFISIGQSATRFGTARESSSAYSATNKVEYIRSKYENRIQFLKNLATYAEIGLTILTVSSLVLAVYPSFPYKPIAPKYVRIMLWCDFFGFALFLLDLLMRFQARNRKETPTLYLFLLDNWYDIPALVATDIPLTVYRFPDLLGLFKGFRIIRLYRRFTQQAVFVSMMVKQPMLYLATFVTLIIVACAVFIKIIEQEEQEQFRDFTNVLWFSMVTVTTVGYGDLQVKRPLTQLLTFVLMLMGIGLISTLSAFLAERLVSVGKAEEKKRQMKENLKSKAELLKVGLLHIAEPYNPLSVTMENIMDARKTKPAKGSAMDNIAGRNDAKAEQQIRWMARNYETLEKHRSSALNVTVGMKTHVTLPIERVMVGAGGKFRISAVSSQADLIRAVAKEYEKGMLVHVLRLQNGIDGNHHHPNGSSNKIKSRRANDHDEESLEHEMLINRLSKVEFTPRTRLYFLLLRYSLHKPERGGVHNFTEMADELADIIFERTRPQSIYLEKVFCIDQEWKRLRASPDEETPPFYYFDYEDPIQEKLVRVDEHFERYGINKRVDYNEIITEINILILLYDRVETVRWGLQNLKYKDPSKQAKPVLEEVEPPIADLPITDMVLLNPLGENDAEEQAKNTASTPHGRKMYQPGKSKRTTRMFSRFHA